MKKFLLLISLSLPIFVNAQKLMTADVAQVYAEEKWQDVPNNILSIIIQENNLILINNNTDDQTSYTLLYSINKKDDIFRPNFSIETLEKVNIYYNKNNVLIIKISGEEDVRVRLKNVKYYIN